MRAPDIDRTLDYTPRWIRTPGRCRLRVWHDEAVVLVSELDENPGPSVTNSIEEIAQLVELILVRSVDRLRLIEHYPYNATRGSTYDLVSFVGRNEAGQLVGPVWAPLRDDDLRRELREVVEGADFDVSVN